MLTRHLVRQFGALSGANVATAALSFVALAVLAQRLTPAQLGRVVFAQSVAATAFAFLDPRLEDAVIRYVPIVGADDPVQARLLQSRALQLDLFIASIGVVVAVIVVAVFRPSSAVAVPTLLVLALVANWAQAPLGTASAAFAVSDRLELLGWLTVVMSLGSTALAIAGLFISGASGYLLGVLAGNLLVTCVVGVVGLELVRRSYPGDGPRAPLPAGLLRFTAVSSLASSLTTATDRLPLAVIGVVGGPVMLAQFRVASAPGRLTATAFSPLSSISFPVFSRALAERDVDGARRHLRRVVMMGGMLAVGVVVGAAILLPSLIPALFGSTYKSVATAATLLVVAAALRGLVVWSKVLPLALGRPTVRVIALLMDGAGLLAVTATLSGHGVVPLAIGHAVVAAIAAALWLAGGTRLLATTSDFVR
ncbi:MAG: hypothetical protein QOF60_2393 [Actinomycetota bacterium]|nr:hypothetical protein [Actinomycetota bacterium]